MRTIVCLLVLALTSVLHAADGTPSAHIVLLHVNDSHGHTQSWLDDGKSVGGYARVKTVVDAIRQQEGVDHVIFLHAGDEISRGDTLTSATLGEGNIAILNLMGIAAWTPGNGEFYPGAANLQKLISEANFPTLTGNIRYRLDGKPFADETTILTVQGVRVGLLGLCFIHEEYPSSWVLKMEPPADAARRLIPQLRKNADLVIALNHIGIDADRKLAASVPGIDLIVGGHSHTVLREGERVTGPAGREVLIVQAGEYLHYIGRVDLELQRKGDAWILQKSAARLIPLDATVPEDPAIKSTIARLWPATQPATAPADDTAAMGTTALPAK